MPPLISRKLPRSSASRPGRSRFRARRRRGASAARVAHRRAGLARLAAPRKPFSRFSSRFCSPAPRSRPSFRCASSAGKRRTRLRLRGQGRAVRHRRVGARMGFPALPHSALAVRAGAALRERPPGGRRAAFVSPERALMVSVPVRLGRREAGKIFPAYRVQHSQRARADEGRDPLRPTRHARRVHRARHVDDVEVRALGCPSAARRAACGATRASSPRQSSKRITRRYTAELMGFIGPSRTSPRRTWPRTSRRWRGSSTPIRCRWATRAGDRHRQADRSRRLGFRREATGAGVVMVIESACAPPRPVISAVLSAASCRGSATSAVFAAHELVREGVRP